MKFVKIFLLCPIFFVLLSSCGTDNSDPDFPAAESGPGSDEEIPELVVGAPTQDNTQAQMDTQQINEIESCGEKTDPGYLTCRFEQSQRASTQARQEHETHICRKNDQPDVVLRLTEFFYPTNRPNNALVCTISANDNLKGFAHYTQSFCRNNSKPNGQRDSLKELMDHYQSPNMGYICTQDTSAQ